VAENLRHYLAGPGLHPQQRVTPTLTPLPGDQLCEGEDYGFSDSGLAPLALLEQGDGGCGGQENLNGVAASAGNVTGQRQGDGPDPGRFRAAGMLVPRSAAVTSASQAISSRRWSHPGPAWSLDEPGEPMPRSAPVSGPSKRRPDPRRPPGSEAMAETVLSGRVSRSRAWRIWLVVMAWRPAVACAAGCG
jgi:hypothetical protein